MYAPLMTTHFAVIKDGTVIGSRSSASFGIGGKCYRFASCWHQVGGGWSVATWHTTAALAAKSRPVNVPSRPEWPVYDGHVVAPVLIVTRRVTVGAPAAAAILTPEARAEAFHQAGIAAAVAESFNDAKDGRS